MLVQKFLKKLKQFTSELWMTLLNSKSIRNRTKKQAAPSNHQMCSVTKGVLRNFAKFTRKRLCRSLFFNKVAGPYYRTPPDDCFCPIFINLLLEQKLFQKGPARWLPLVQSIHFRFCLYVDKDIK